LKNNAFFIFPPGRPNRFRFTRYHKKASALVISFKIMVDTTAILEKSEETNHTNIPNPDKPEKLYPQISQITQIF
jgi:hypothetical protein